MEPAKFINVTAIVLAGGKNTRMGGVDKSLLPVKGIPMIRHIADQLHSHFSEILIGGDVAKYNFLGYRVIPDVSKGMGPLMGIYSCLLASGSDLNFITACDIPDINISLVSKMLELAADADIVMPVHGEDSFEPLHAIYRKTVIPVARELLDEGRLRIAGLFGVLKTKFIPFDGREWYYNLNYPADYNDYNEDKKDPV